MNRPDTAEEPRLAASTPGFGPGLGFALLSAASFASSGTLATGLLEAGWSPGLAVTLRIAIGALALLPVVGWTLHGRWGLLRASGRLVLLYGATAVALPQACFFFAVQRLPVGPALLIEYTAPLLVLVWQWALHAQRPTGLTAVGAIVAMVGLVLVLGLTTSTPLDAVGVAWAFAGCFGAAAFFILSAHASTGLPPLALAGGGLAAGATLLALLGAVGVLPMTSGDAVARFGGAPVPAWVALVGLGLLAGAIAYGAGIAATRRLGPRLASFVGLSEVVIAFAYAWLLLGQTPSGTQAVGAGLILAGVALVKLGEPES